ncbi:MAG: hypothetical protein AB2L14_00295 [Candidatus Xenobiia bacterium LiM19]
MKKSSKITVQKDYAEEIECRFDKSSRVDREKEEIRLFIQEEKKAMIRELEQECSDVITRMQSAMEDYRRYFLESLSRDMKQLIVNERSCSFEKSPCKAPLLDNDNPEAANPSIHRVGEVVPAENRLPGHACDAGAGAPNGQQSFSSQPAVEGVVKDYLSTIDGDIIGAILDDFIGDQVETPEEISSQRQVKNREEKTYSEIDGLLAQNGFVPADYQIMQSEEVSQQSSREAEIDELTASPLVNHHRPA